jgi:hypothetical protein
MDTGSFLEPSNVVCFTHSEFSTLFSRVKVDPATAGVKYPKKKAASKTPQPMAAK